MSNVFIDVSLLKLVCGVFLRTTKMYVCSLLEIKTFWVTTDANLRTRSNNCETFRKCQSWWKCSYFKQGIYSENMKLLLRQSHTAQWCMKPKKYPDLPRFRAHTAGALRSSAEVWSKHLRKQIQGTFTGGV